MRLDSCWIWVCNNHPTTFLRYSAPPLDECKFATVIANSPTGGRFCGIQCDWDLTRRTYQYYMCFWMLKAFEQKNNWYMFQIDDLDLPAWHFRRLVTISHPKSLKTAKFTYCWLWILTCGPRCAPKCGDSKAVRLWIPWKNFDWKKKSALEPHVNQRGLDWKKLIELRFSTFVGWSFKSRKKLPVKSVHVLNMKARSYQLTHNTP